MVIGTEATLALYCPHCGKLHMHVFNRFSMRLAVTRQLKCSCGQVQATVTSVSRHQYLLDIPCIICETNHKVTVDARRFWKAAADKVYCADENIELGLIGQRRIIEETIAKHKHEFEKLLREKDYDDEHIDNPQAMIEVFNHVHDLAAQGGVNCRCGMPILDAEVLPDCVALTCRQCGSRLFVPANDESDVEMVKAWETIELLPSRRTRRKH